MEMVQGAFTLELVFDPESFETVAESPVAYVTKGVYRRDASGRLIAIKSASIQPHFSKQPHDIVKELRLLTKLSHVNVIDVLGHGTKQATSSLHFWMPFIPYKLRDLLDSPTFTPHPVPGGARGAECEATFCVLTRALTYQIISGVKYLHQQLIAHRDIKPGNVLIDDIGLVKLIDFGIAWADPLAYANEDDLWPEPPGRMCFDVATGPYRAPELLFGASSYDAFATDLWSLGVTCAEFFTSLRLHDRYDDDEDPDDDFDEEQPKPPFITPKSVDVNDPDAEWTRDPLFDASRGSIGLAWSIFKTRGTPTQETWPDLSLLPDAGKVTFQMTPKQDLQTLLPNLPPAAAGSTCMDLVERFLAYQPSLRLTAADALHHPWFTESPMLLVPPGYPETAHDVRYAAMWEGRTLSDLLLAKFNTPLAHEYNTGESLD